ncbi:MAG: L,D-transpeptidase family protein [Alphaproteobacteria bacterium]
MRCSPFLLLIVFFISACASPDQVLPVSERLEQVKFQREMIARRDVAFSGFEYGAPAFIRIFKQESALELWLQEPGARQFGLYKTYPICNYSGELGPKIMEGDQQAPEGFYTIHAEQMNPWSRFHLSFNMGFPNEYDAAWGRTGSALMIHGGCKSTGCYALTDELIEEVYLLTEASIQGGTPVPVHIFPFRMHAQNMYLHRNTPWIHYWYNLKEGYDAFEYTRIPPDTAVDITNNGPIYIFRSPPQTFKKILTDLEKNLDISTTF